MARVIDFIDGVTSETPPTIGNIVASALVQYPDDATYEANEDGAPAIGNLYYNTTDNVIRYYNGTKWLDQIDEDTVQILENKGLDADNNLITNITDDEIKAAAAINVTKLASGTVDNTEFETLNGVTSSIQTQLDSKIPDSEKGVANGVATLDGSALVPASQLPSYVDDVIEVADFASLPVTGETGKIYVTLDDNKTYRWTGSVYVEVGPASQANNNSVEEGGFWDWVLGVLNLSTPISETTTDFNQSWTMDNTTNRVAYNFQPGSTFTATGITIFWDDGDSAVGDFVIEIMPITGALPGEPDESTVLATTALIDASTVGVGSQKYNFVTPVELTIGVDYAYAHRVTNTGPGTAMIYDANSSGPAGTYRYTTTDSGANWSNAAGFTGTFEIHSDIVTDSNLTLDTDAYIQQEGFDKTRNTLQAQTISFSPTEDIAYVTVNKTVDSVTNLTINKATLSSYAPGDDDLIIARVIEDGIEIARKLYLKDAQSSILQKGIGQLSTDDITDMDTSTTPPVIGEVLKWDGTNFVPGEGGGTGDGGINYIPNPDAEIDVSDWITYDDSSTTEPVDGIGGVGTVTLGTGDTLRGTKSFFFSRGTTDKQGSGISTELLTIDNFDRNKRLNVSFEYWHDPTAVGTYASGDVVCFVYDIDNATLLGPIDNGNGGIVDLSTDFGSKLTGTFYATDSLNYRLIFHFATTTLENWQMSYDRVKIGPVESFVQSQVERSEVIDLTSNGDFTGGTLLVSRTGNQVSVKVETSLTFASTTQADSAAGLIPEWARPISTASFNLSVFNTSSVVEIYINTDGSYHMESRNWAGGGSALTSLNQGDISYAVESSTNVVSNTELTQQTIYLTSDTLSTVTHTTNNTFQDISFTEISDKHNTFDGTIFTAPRDGFYSISATVNFGSSATGRRGLQALLTNADRSSLPGDLFYSGGTGTFGCNLYGSVFINKGGTVKIQAFQSSGGSLAYSSNAQLSIKSDPDFTSYGVLNPNTEYIQAKLVANTAWPAAQNVFHDIDSITLEPGTWDISGLHAFGSSGSVSISTIDLGISSTSGNSSTGLEVGHNFVHDTTLANSGFDYTNVIPPHEVVITTTTTFYLKVRDRQVTTNMRSLGYRISARRTK